MFSPRSVASKQEMQDLYVSGHPLETIEVITEVLGRCSGCGNLVRRCDTMGSDAHGKPGHLECLDPEGWGRLIGHVKRQREEGQRS